MSTDNLGAGSEDNRRFKKPNGDLTQYAFACGYIQEDKKSGVRMNCENMDINLYSIHYENKYGNHIWDQYIGLARARRNFNKIVNRINKGLL